MINLGSRAKDKITGFSGIVVARVEYLNGCIQYCIKPEMCESGKMPGGEYIDEKQLELIDDGINIPSESTGGLMSDMPSDKYRG